jgi:signal transduction histidine kinase
MRLLPKSAANRIAVFGLLAYVLATFLASVAVYIATHEAFVRQIDARIALATNDLQSEYRDEGIGDVADAISHRESGEPGALGYAIFDSTNHRIAGSLDTPMPPIGWHNIVFRDPVEGPDAARANVIMLGASHRLVVAADLEPLEAIDQTILEIFGLTFLALLLLGGFGAVILARYLRVRLSRIEQTADAIIAGNFAQRAPVGKRNDEFDRVAASLNAMLDRIAGLIANLRQVTSDLAHDLRTPLARLRNNLESLRHDTKEERLDDAVEEADDVLRLFEAILRISELEEGGLRRGFAQVDLSHLVADIGESHLPLAEDSGHRLYIAVEEGLTVNGDRELLAQAIINLLENALRHTPEGGTISLIARERDGIPAVIIRDEGSGIPEAERERVMQRFVRLEAARSTPGHGLGLSLVKAIVEAHGGSVSLSDAQPGLAVEIDLPGGEVR